MAPIGLAHRPTSHAFVAEWTDLEPEPVEDEDLRVTVERRLRSATEAARAEAPSEGASPSNAAAADGWLAGEPMS